MGSDKEATDLWVFGRPRPDLTPAETFEAANALACEPSLPAAEVERRQQLIRQHSEKRHSELMARAPELVAGARAKAASQGIA